MINIDDFLSDLYLTIFFVLKYELSRPTCRCSVHEKLNFTINFFPFDSFFSFTTDLVNERKRKFRNIQIKWNAKQFHPICNNWIVCLNKPLAYLIVVVQTRFFLSILILLSFTHSGSMLRGRLVNTFFLLSLFQFAFTIPSPEQQDHHVRTEQNNGTSDVADNNYRLPTSITPENYNLEIFTHLNDSEGFLFRGIVAITVSLY